MDCNDAEIALCKQERAQLTAEETELLGHHLARCGACRAFQKTSWEAEMTMQAQVVEQIEKIDWGKLEGKLAELRKHDLNALVRGLGITAFLAITIAATTGGPDLSDYLRKAASAAVFGLFVTALLAMSVWQRRKETAAVQSSPLELLVAYRAQVASDLKQVSRGRAFLPIMSIYFGFDAVRGMLREGVTGEHVLAGCVALFLAFMTAVVVKRHKQLNSEIAQLS